MGAKMIDTISAFIKKIFYPLNFIGGLIIILMMFFTFCTVILRYLFNSPIPGDFELIVFALIVMVACALSFTMVKDRHVTVSFFSLPDKGQLIINIVTHIIAFAVFSLSCWQTILYGNKLIKYGQHSAILHLPESIFIYLFAFGLFLLCVVILVKILSFIVEASKK